ncbi:MAG: hypothetical protein ACO26C_06670 [Ilumatobacteraceae bacterium]|jgi:hypothetical protein
MSDHAVDVVVLTEREARIWHGLPPRADEHAHPTEPERVEAPDQHRPHRHVRTGQFHRGHHLDHDDPRYFEDVVARLGDAERLLLVGHGRGRSNMARAFMDHVGRRHRTVARRVIGEIEGDLSALTEPEILEMARRWYAGYCQRV